MCGDRTGQEIQEAFTKFYDDPKLLRPVRGAPLEYQFMTYHEMLPVGFDNMPQEDKVGVSEHVKSRCMRFRYIYFDVLKYSHMARFIALATHWPTWAVADLNSLPSQYLTPNVIECDVRKDYCQHRCARNYGCYRGFMGKITDMGPCTFEDFEKHWVGAYRVVKFDWTGVDKHFALMHKHWPVYVDGHCYATPLILYFLKLGGKVEIDYGLWGMAFDFEFPDYMYMKQPKVDADGKIVGDGAALYSLLAGFCASGDNKVSYSFKCDAEFLGVLMQHQRSAGEDVHVHFDQSASVAYITHKTTSKRGAPQFSMYVTAYSLLHTMEQMRRIPDHRDILAVKCDAILVSTRYYKLTGPGPRVPLTPGYDDAQTGAGKFHGGDPMVLWRTKLVPFADVRGLQCTPGATIASGIFDPERNPRSSKWLVDQGVFREAKSILQEAQKEAAAGCNGYYLSDCDLDVGDISVEDLDRRAIAVQCIGDALDLLLTNNGMTRNDLLEVASGSLRDDYVSLQREQEEIMWAVSQAPKPKMPPNRNIVGEDGEISPNVLFNRQMLVFMGSGGCGKTTSVFGDPRFGPVAMMVVPHCQRNMFQQRNEDPNDHFVTQLAVTEVVAMTSKTYECQLRYQRFLASAGVFVIDEGSMIQPEKLSEMISHLRGIGKVIVCMDRYQTPPIQLSSVTSPSGTIVKRELQDEDFQDLGAHVHEFWYSYRQLPDDPVRQIIHDMRKDMCDELFTPFRDSADPRYEAASAMLAERWCRRLVEIKGMSMDDVVRTMRYDDYVMSYTNHNARVFDEYVNKNRKFHDSEGNRVFRWVVQTNAFRELGLFNGSVRYQTMSPIAQTDGQAQQHPPELRQYVTTASRKRKRSKRDQDEGEDGGNAAPSSSSSSSMSVMQGHTKTRCSCVVQWCGTIHGVQGATIELGQRAFVDTNGLRDIRVLQTAVSRVRSMDQLYFFNNELAQKIVDDENSFKGYIYMLRYIPNERTELLPSHTYIGRTTSKTMRLANANNRLQQHRRACASFVNENTQRAKLNRKEFRMPCPGVHGWCNSFYVIYPVLQTAMEDVEALIIDTFYFTEAEKDTARQVMERAEHKWIEHYQGQGNTNVHGVELI